jgi:hypothetical protein
VLLLGNGEWHQVEAIALQVTTLLRWDGVKARSTAAPRGPPAAPPPAVPPCSPGSELAACRARAAGREPRCCDAAADRCERPLADMVPQCEAAAGARHECGALQQPLGGL